MKLCHDNESLESRAPLLRRAYLLNVGRKRIVGGWEVDEASFGVAINLDEGSLKMCNDDPKKGSSKFEVDYVP